MEAENSEESKTDELLCKKCRIKDLGYGLEICEKHGMEYIDWKCMRCCSMAVFFCNGGKATFCTPCHNDAMNGVNEVHNNCTGGDCCPLGIPEHPKAGTETDSCFPLGCSLCRSENVAQI